MNKKILMQEQIHLKNKMIINGICSMLPRLVWTPLVCLLFQCEPAVEPNRRFTIYGGQHYSVPWLTESLQSEKLVFKARFNKSAIYHFADPSTQSNRNKLMGFCDCNSLVHENSARFAWVWLNDRLEIYAYCYVNGGRHDQFVGVADIDKYNRYEIALTEDQYIFRLDDNPPVYVKRGNNCSIGVYLKLWPYFGGPDAAPHDVTIDIKTVY